MIEAEMAEQESLSEREPVKIAPWAPGRTSQKPEEVNTVIG